ELVVSLVKKLIAQGEDAKKILDEGLMPGMDEIAVRFSGGDMFIPEVLASAEAMHAGNELLRALLVKDNVEKRGKVVLGTVAGDLHDIGKRIVGMMLEGSGYEVIDLGMDVPSSRFLEAAKKEKPDIIGMSALLTTTMPAMQEVVEILKEEGLDKEIEVMIGGAPVSDEYAKRIGAHYSYDAGSAVELANRLVGYVRR
ncbi:MAG TPA: corrinoid protein, partial [Anaerovoracaceae bacterium]|nr:corrinoid protein [Anaerovoracaceae bacterium]